MTYQQALGRLQSVVAASARLRAELPEGVPDLRAAEVRLAEGLPALAGEPLIDWETLRSHVLELDPSVQPGVDALTERVEPAAIAEAALAGAWEAIGHPVIATLLDYAARPSLRAGQRAVTGLIAQSHWNAGTCPACNALPGLAELRSDKEGRTRVLRCMRCLAAWPFPRLVCPACGERDHARLRYIHIDAEQDRRRAECCRSCGFYVKALALLDTLDEAELLQADLDTLALDSAAIDAGYRRHPAPDRS